MAFFGRDHFFQVEYVSCEPSEAMKELFPEQYGVDDDSFEEEETEQA